jgi:hypothetical protein
VWIIFQYGGTRQPDRTFAVTFLPPVSTAMPLLSLLLLLPPLLLLHHFIPDEDCNDQQLWNMKAEFIRTGKSKKKEED